MVGNSESGRGHGGALLVNAGGGRRERQFGVACVAGTRVGGRLIGSSLIKVGVSRKRRPITGLTPHAQLCWCC